MPFDDTLVPVHRERAGSIISQIVALVMENVERGMVNPGDRLPTERELANRLGVARGTVKAAYKRMEEGNIIRTRQGSGSYVVRDEELARRFRREKAVGLLEETIVSLTALGMKTEEISRLFDACLAQMPDRVIAIAVISDTPELLMDMKRQLSFLQGAQISVFILESITENHDPEGLLRGFDIIVAPTADCRKISALLPRLAGRLTEVAVGPSSETLAHLASIPGNARIGVICRSSSFLALLKKRLLECGLQEVQVLSFFEMDYTIETYFPGGIDVLISFADAHIFTDPAFTFRNEEFWAKGGKIVAFRHQINREALLQMEERVQRLRRSHSKGN